MELLVQLIFVVALLKYCLKASLAGGFRVMLCYALGAGVWALAWYPVVIYQPVTIVEQLLTDKQVVTDGAVWTTIEAILGIMLSVRLLDNYFAPKQLRKRSLFILKVVPGLLAPASILYFELLFFKWRVAQDFLVTALLYALICVVALFAIAWLIKRMVEGESLKLEMKLLFNMTILVVGLLINSAVADYNISAAHTETEWLPLIAILSLTALLIATGYWTRNWNWKKLFTHKK